MLSISSSGRILARDNQPMAGGRGVNLGAALGASAAALAAVTAGVAARRVRAAMR